MSAECILNMFNLDINEKTLPGALLFADALARIRAQAPDR